MSRAAIETLKIAGLVAVAIAAAIAIVPCRPWKCGRLPSADALPAERRDAAPPVGDGTAEMRLSNLALAGAPTAWRDVVQAATGHEVVAVDERVPGHRALVELLERAAAAVTDRFNADDSPVRGLPRINEASRFLEDWLAEAIDAETDWRCGPAPTARGAIQRSGYPDLVIRHAATGLVAYLDPKLMAADSLDSTLRTFYYSPRDTTGKILEDALHLVIGFQHDGAAGRWRINGWHLVDLSLIQVDAKLEFNASNRILYDPAATLRRRGPAAPQPRDGLPAPPSRLD